MEQDKSRNIWELLSDAFRESAILLWIFGGLLDHENLGLKHGIVMAIGGVVLFALGLIFEAQRERKNRKGPKC